MQNRKKQFVGWIGVSVALTIIMLQIGLRYEQPDDYLISGIIGGAYGKGLNQILIAPYISPVLGIILNIIYIITGFFNVYSLFLIVAYLLCITNLHAIVYWQGKSWKWNLFICLFEIFYLFYFTYTTVAYLLIGTGILIIYVKNNRETIGIQGGVSILLGILLRKQVLISTVFLLLPILTETGKQKRKLMQIIIFFLAVSGSTTMIQQLAYHTTDTWAIYWEWNEASTRLRDFKAIPYEKYQSELKKTGWSENDLEMMKHWQFADINVFSTISMEKIGKKHFTLGQV